MSYQVRHSMSYPLMPGYAPHPAPAHTPYQIRNSETRNPEPAGPEHGAVERSGRKWANHIHLGLMNSMRCLLSGYSDLA